MNSSTSNALQTVWILPYRAFILSFLTQFVIELPQIFSKLYKPVYSYLKFI